MMDKKWTKNKNVDKKNLSMDKFFLSMDKKNIFMDKKLFFHGEKKKKPSTLKYHNSPWTQII